MGLYHTLRRWLWKTGVDVTRSSPLTHRMQLIEKYAIDLVLDVGANTGQFARQLRQYGYTGRIVSFEPLRAALLQLQTQAARDPAWEVWPYALGDTVTKQSLNI